MFRVGIIGLFLSIFVNGVQAEVIPDGNTATSISNTTVGTNTVTSVVIAPANSDGISHNTYTQFDVPTNGIALDNNLAAARTIINEVTSANVSRLEGDIRVLGTRAHVIVANPNGVMVDGANFINTGNVAITTGAVGFVTRSISGGATPVQQVNTVVTTTQGKITIGEGGLTGTMNSLDLIAKEIEINGNVTVENLSPLASLEIHQGDSEFEFDSAVATNNLSNIWNTLNSSGGIAQDQVLVDITSQASLRASSINVVVNDMGAGFRHAGNILADQDGFTLSSTGLVELNDGVVDASSNVVINAADLSLNGIDRQAILRANNGGLLAEISGDVSNVGGLIQGNQTILGNARSRGGLTLDIGGNLLNRSASADMLSVLFSEAGALTLDVDGDVRNESARIFSNAGASLNIAGDFHNTTPIADFDGRGELSRYTREGHRVWYSLFLLKRKTQGAFIDFGEADIETQDGILLTNGDLSISASNVFNQGGVMNASGVGDINVSTNTFINERFQTGYGVFEVTCAWWCDRSAFSTVKDHGGRVQAGGQVTINAATRVDSIGGEFIGNEGLTFTSPEITARAIDDYNAIFRSQGLRGLFKFNDAKLLRSDQGGTFIANMGQISFNTFAPIRIDGGRVIQNGEDNTEEENEAANIIITPPTADSPFVRNHQGLFGGFL